MEPIIAAVPPRHVAGQFQRTGYGTLSQRKLSAEQGVVFRAEAASRSLRDLAADFGVSHETVRAVLRERQAVEAA